MTTQVSVDLGEEYRCALREYLAEGNETALIKAYKLGRDAIESGMGLLDITQLHQQALTAILQGLGGADKSVRTTQEAAAFLAECLGPFEMAMSGFREANAALQARSETLEQHVATVSHELRTPLTMIQGFSELLMMGTLGETESREAIRQVNAAAARLSRLIDDLLSVSRLESGRLVVRKAPIDLTGVVEEVLAPFTTKRNVDVEIEPEVPPVMADRDMLVQVLTNLVSNAVKYSPEGAPVSIRAAEQGDTVEVAVEDRGIGMTEEDAAAVFGKFVRVDRDEVRKAGGSGLGLYITKQLVEKQGGRIWVRSELGDGSAFLFSLPAASESDGTPSGHD